MESERWRSFSSDALVASDKANLDIIWLRNEPLEDADNLPAPEVLARETLEDLTAAWPLKSASIRAGRAG